MKPARLILGVAAGCAVVSAAFVLSFAHDEFGRNQLGTLVGAVVLSLLRAVTLSALLFVVSFSLALLMEVKRRALLNGGVRLFLDGLESVPIYVWVLAGVSWAPRGEAIIVTSTFVIAGLPLLVNALQGIVRQVTNQPFYLSAVALGAGGWHLVRYHIVPNALPYAWPLLVNVLGAAIAVYGAVGIFGFMNRRELDLGVFLLRGKELSGVTDSVLVSTIFSFVLIYWILYALISRTRRRQAARG